MNKAEKQRNCIFFMQVINFIAIIALLLVSTQTEAQNMKELIKQYEVHCNRTAKDTIQQYGHVTMKHIPVKSPTGEISHFVLQAIDTVWSKPECPKYKYNPRQNSFLIGGSNMTTTLAIGNLYSDDGYVFTGVTETPMEVTIKRDHLCEMRRRKVVPFSNHFWEWVKKQK